jgi:uncharacterized membrane protein
MNSKDYSSEMRRDDIEANKVMAGLAYILFFLPLIACPQSRYGRFHANQALILLLFGIVLGIASSIISTLLIFISFVLAIVTGILTLVISLVMLALVVLGMVNGFTGKAKDLPVIGHFRLIKY